MLNGSLCVRMTRFVRRADAMVGKYIVGNWWASERAVTNVADDADDLVVRTADGRDQSFAQLVLHSGKLC